MGKRSLPKGFAKSGRYVKATPVKEGERHFKVALDATLRASLTRGGGREILPVQFSDLQKKRFKRPASTLIVFVVDASDSMGQGTHARMKAAKGAALAFLAHAHLRRQRVAMIAFRDKSAQVILQATASLSLARRKLKSLPTGGATPFADGLMKAWRLIKTERVKEPAVEPLMVVISDGEANIPYDDRAGNLDVQNELLLICRKLASEGIPAVVIDTQPRREGKGNMVAVAQALKASYYHIDGLKAGNVVAVVDALRS